MSRLHDHDFHLPIEKEPATTNASAPPNSPLAVVSLVFGILGFVPLPLIGSIIAIVTGHAAMGQIRDERGRVGGRSLARAGMTLGYISLAIIVATLTAVLWFTTFAVREMRTTMAVATPAPYFTPPVAGVKMINEMERGDFRLIEDHKLDVKSDEILACYNAGGSPEEPELALLTTRRIIYLKDGRTTAVDLKDVVSLKDDRKYDEAYHQTPGGVQRDISTYHIEIRTARGPRIRINIKPEEQGQPFYDALETAWKAAGGVPAEVEKATR